MRRPPSARPSFQNREGCGSLVGEPSLSTQFDTFSRFDAPAKGLPSASGGKQATDVVSASSVEREATIPIANTLPATAQPLLAEREREIFGNTKQL